MSELLGKEVTVLVDVIDVQAAIQGDRQALESLLKVAYQQLYKTAFLYVKNEADALDIVQDSVIKIMTKIDSLTQPEFFTTWAVRIVIHTSLDLLRRPSRQVLTEPLEQLEATNGLSQESRLDIYAGIASLPDDLQEVTILHYFHGRKLKEISLLTEEPLGTTKYKLHLARGLLRQYLEGGEFHEND